MVLSNDPKNKNTDVTGDYLRYRIAVSMVGRDGINSDVTSAIGTKWKDTGMPGTHKEASTTRATERLLSVGKSQQFFSLSHFILLIKNGGKECSSQELLGLDGALGLLGATPWWRKLH